MGSPPAFALCAAVNRLGAAVACFACSLSPAFGADAEPRPSDYLIAAWQVENGLPQNSVTCITQTRDGYLWLGTSNGLARFDGVRFVTFRSTDTPGLRNNRIQCLGEDRQGVLWIGTDGGGLVRREHGQFVSLSAKEGLSSDRVTCLAEDHDGQLWVGTASGLNRLDQGRFVSFFTLNGLPEDSITALLPHRDGLWAGTSRGLARFRAGRWARVNLNFPPSPEGVSWLRESQGSLWGAGPSGLWCVGIPGNETHGELIHHGPVCSLAETTKGEIWFGSAAGRLFRLGRNRADVEEMARLGSAVLALQEDREGNLWAGTAGDGLYRLKPRQLRVIRAPEGVSPEEVLALSESPAGKVWLVTGTRGIQVWEEETWRVFLPRGLPESASARTVAGDESSGLWIGTQGDGLLRWEQGRLQGWSQREGLSDSVIEALCSDGRAGLWVATRNGGLNHWQAGEVSRVHTPWGFTGNFACVLARDHLGRLWIGTSGDGLFCYSNGVYTAFTTHAGLPHNVVHALLPEENLVWVGTAGGLARIQGNAVKAFTQKDGLPEEAMVQLQADDAGNLWVGTTRGLFRLRKQQLHDYADGRTRFLDAVPYGQSDGLTDVEALPGAQVRNDGAMPGRMWFVTSRGLVRAEQGARQWNSRPPPVVLEQVLVENEPVPLAAEIKVPPGREKIQFQYTALSFTAPEKVRFRVWLERFDRNWVEMAGQRTARYPRVPPGRYDFRVSACNNDGVWNEAGASVRLVVAPFWWQTVWFRVALVVLAAAAGTGWLRMRHARRHEMERLRVRLAADLHDEIGSSLWSITLLSRILQKDGQMGADERRDVGEIHRIAQQSSGAIRDIVWLINPAYDTAQDLVLRMRDFAGTLLRGAEHRLQCDRVDLSRKLPLDFRQNVFLLFKETVTNIAKHAQASEVEILLEERAARWQLTIRDNGVGFDPAGHGSGHGLKSLRQRAEKIGGKLTIRSQPGQGTSVTLSVPCP